MDTTISTILGAIIGAVAVILVGFFTNKNQRESTRKLEEQVQLTENLAKQSSEQNRLLTIAMNADLLMKFEDQFFGKRMRAARLAVATLFLFSNSYSLKIEDDETEEKWEDLSDIFDFFQGLGTIVASEAIPTDMAYKSFYYWMKFYFEAGKNYIEYQQKYSPITWADACYLYKECKKNDSKKEITNEDFKQFFEWEIRNLPKYD